MPAVKPLSPMRSLVVVMPAKAGTSERLITAFSLAETKVQIPDEKFVGGFIICAALPRRILRSSAA